jgi:hypothetical protein
MIVLVVAFVLLLAASTGGLPFLRRQEHTT